ncbi:MAG: hypothetical protein KC466_14055 [Myxococcales bacterium]|nr:hypothetical protein [Myxococcales bacterium]
MAYQPKGNHRSGGRVLPCAPLTATERRLLENLDGSIVVLPDQFYSADRSDLGFDSERRLMLAVLMDALKMYRKNLPAKTRRAANLLAETEAWFFDEPDEDWLYSFENICLTLNLNPDSERDCLRGIREIVIDGADLPGLRRNLAAVGLM